MSCDDQSTCQLNQYKLSGDIGLYMTFKQKFLQLDTSGHANADANARISAITIPAFLYRLAENYGRKAKLSSHPNCSK